MDEARRTLRYVFPGLAAAALFLGLWMFVFPALHRPPASLSGAEGGGSAIAGVFGTVVAGGGLGYVASQLYFFLHWLPRKGCGPTWLGPTDHRDVATFIKENAKASSRGKDNVKASGGSVKQWEGTDPAQLSDLRRAWVTLTAWWFLTAGVDTRVANATKRTTSLMDHSHSSGIFACAVFVAGVAWAAVAWCLLDATACRLLTGAGIVLVIALVPLRNCFRTRVMFEQLVEVTARRAILDPAPAPSGKAPADDTPPRPKPDAADHSPAGGSVT